MNYVNTFIRVAPDTRATKAAVPLAKTYGWGLHFNREGKVAIVPLESADDTRFASSRSIEQTHAMRSKRGG